jgi:glycerophosphoryl diester phosphodiesterase
MFSEHYRKDRPLVFGHRGASAYAPMNTLPAFELAMTQGADGVELDVWLSKDGHLVIIHDSTVDHTTDGTGYVWDKSLADLKALDASHTFPTYRGARIPTLDEVFEAVGRLLLVNVEIKWAEGALPGVEQAVAECIRRHALEDRVIVSSFEPKILSVFRKIMPAVAAGYLFEPSTPLLLSGTHYDALHPHHSQIEAATAKAWRERGYRLNTWTVNDPARALELRELRVDTVITDAPDKILEAYRNGATRG